MDKKQLIYHNGEWIEGNVDEIIEKAAKEGRLLYHNGKKVDNNIFEREEDANEIDSEMNEFPVDDKYKIELNLFGIDKKELLYLLKKIEVKINAYFFDDEIIKDYIITRNTEIQEEAMLRILFYFRYKNKGKEIVDNIIKKRIKKKPSLRKYGVEKIREQVWMYFMLGYHDYFPYLKDFRDRHLEEMDERIRRKMLEEL